MTISKNRVNDLRALAQRKHRQQAGLFLVEGFRLVTESLASPLIKELLITHEFSASPSGEALVGKLPPAATVSTISNVQAEQISTTRQPQGVFALLTTLHSEIPSLGKLSGPILILADIADPGNLGTILRTAGWFNLPTVLVSAASSDIYNPKVLRSAMGAHFHIPSLFQGDLHETMLALKASNIEVLAAVMDGTNMQEIRVAGDKWALLIGNEAHGLSEYWHAMADHKVTIPARGSVESLNVTVATGILLQNLMG